MLDGACRLNNGDRSQVDKLAEFYAEETYVRHPMAPLGDTRCSAAKHSGSTSPRQCRPA
ncbi:hypothetical protein NKH77_50355 [Streptomyces sp. M19]